MSENLDVEITHIDLDWNGVVNAARVTVGKESTASCGSPIWRYRMLLAEHSPIRRLSISWVWHNLKSWVSVHFVRHKYGIEHWVTSQRDDRNDGRPVSRDDLPQSALVSHEAQANAQAIINISRKRLCSCASKETREAWEKVVSAIAEEDPILASVCVKDCIYRGYCYEMKSCNYFKTSAYATELGAYRTFQGVFINGGN